MHIKEPWEWKTGRDQSEKKKKKRADMSVGEEEGQRETAKVVQRPSQISSR